MKLKLEKSIENVIKDMGRMKEEVETVNLIIPNRRVSRSVSKRAMTSHEMETRSFYMTIAGPLG